MATKRCKNGAATPPKSAKKSIAEAISELFQQGQSRTTDEQLRSFATELGNIKLPPIVERIARDLYQRMGRHLCPNLDAWKFTFFAGGELCLLVPLAETHVRVFESFMARHPNANPFTVAVTICFGPATPFSDKNKAAIKEIQDLTKEAWLQAWIPLTPSRVEFPTDGSPVVLEYKEVIEDLDGMPHPNLRGKMDPRQIIQAADIVGDVDSGSEEFFCLYGSDHLDDQGTIPPGKKAIFVRLNMRDKTKDELGKIAFAVQMIKAIRGKSLRGLTTQDFEVGPQDVGHGDAVAQMTRDEIEPEQAI